MARNGQEATEATPLLFSDAPQQVMASLTIRPMVELICANAQFLDPDQTPPWPPFASTEEGTAFKLVVYLELHRVMRNRSRTFAEEWDQCARDVSVEHQDREPEPLAVKTWQEYVHEYRNPTEVQGILWYEFPLEDGVSRKVRVIDFLDSNDVPAGLATHRLVTLSLWRTWKYGLIRDEPPAGTSSLKRVFHIYDNFITPRALHLVDLVFHLLFLAVLAHFLLYLPRWNVWFDPRKDWLIFYSMAQLNRAQILHLAPYVFLLLSVAAILFHASFPFFPEPPSGDYNTLRFLFVFLFLRLHLPASPSPVFLLSKALRPSATLAHALRRFCLPPISFYLPGIALSVLLLLLSLQDPYFIIVTSPLETRDTLLGLLFFELILLAFTCIIYATGGHEAGIEQHTRRALVHAVVRYVGMPFPPPLNLLRGLLVCLPPLTIRRGLLVPLPGLLQERPSEMRRTMERVTWRIFVGPFGMVASALLYLIPRRG